MNHFTHYRLSDVATHTVCGESGDDSVDISRVTCPVCLDMERVRASLAPQYTTEAIDKFYLQLSQFSNATAWRELALKREIERMRVLVSEALKIAAEGFSRGWDGLDKAEYHDGPVEVIKKAAGLK